MKNWFISMLVALPTVFVAVQDQAGETEKQNAVVRAVYSGSCPNLHPCVAYLLGLVCGMLSDMCGLTHPYRVQARRNPDKSTAPY